MYRSRVEFEIAQTQRAMIVGVLESLAVTLFAVVSAALVPQLVYQLLIAMNQTLTAEPVVLTYMPHVLYGFAVLYFGMGIIGNIFRGRRVAFLQQELSVLDYTSEDECCHGGCCGEGECCDGACECHHEGEEGMMAEEVVQEVVEKPAKKTAKKRTTKRAKTATA